MKLFQITSRLYKYVHAGESSLYCSIPCTAKQPNNSLHIREVNDRMTRQIITLEEILIWKYLEMKTRHLMILSTCYDFIFYIPLHSETSLIR